MSLGGAGSEMVRNKVESSGEDWGTRVHMPLLKRQPLKSSGLLLCGKEGLVLSYLPILKERLQIQTFMLFF